MIIADRAVEANYCMVDRDFLLGPLTTILKESADFIVFTILVLNLKLSDHMSI